MYLAFTLNKPPSADKCVTPVALRAPETVLKSKIDEKIDIWSFGCLVYEFLTGSRLSKISGLTEIPEETNDDHLLQMVDLLGHPPPRLLKRWPRRGRYFDQEMQLIRSDVGPSEMAEGEPFQGPSLEESFRESMPEGIGAKEADHVSALLRGMLQYEPSLRPSTSEILANQWFRSI